MPKRTVLLADDDAESADLLGQLLEMYLSETAVFVTHGSEEALRCAAGQRPDVAVLDLEMPEMDGEALAHELRSMFGEQPLLLVALSGNIGLLLQTNRPGVFDKHLSKPADIRALVQIIEERFALLDLGS